MCGQCGAMADLDGTAAPDDALTRARAEGFVPDHAQFVVWGLSRECAASLN